MFAKSNLRSKDKGIATVNVKFHKNFQWKQQE